MKTTVLLPFVIASCLVATSEATIVTVSASRAGPIIQTTGGTTVDGGLIRVGTLMGAPASNSFDDLKLAFEEFENYNTSASGAIGGTVSSSDGTPFNSEQVYLWLFDTPDINTATEHALFTIQGSPSEGDPWVYPIHTGAGTDKVTIDTTLVATEGDLTYTPGVTFEQIGVSQTLTLTPIPEPSGALLLVLGCSALVIRRSRR